MKKIVRGRLTYSNVIATLALFLALGGGAYAATQLPKNSVGAKQIKKNAVSGSKVKDGSLRASDFKKGELAGLKGPQGPPGQAGQPGSPAGSVLSSRFVNEAGLTQTLYGPVSGIGPTSNTNEALVIETSPAVPIVANDLSARYARNSDTPGGIREFILRVNGSDTALKCSYTSPSASCSDTTDSVTIPANSLMAIRFFQGGTNIGDGDILVSIRATTP